MHPELPVSRNYKTKEFAVAEYVKEHFPEISWNFDKQIQILILNGTNTNFIEGSGWPSATSVDVLLEITVTSTTSVTWTIVDDWYNPAPSLLVGKYLVLLRSMGTTIQAHYISKKTN